MIKSFVHWCQDQQEPYGVIIYMFVSMIAVVLIAVPLVYVATAHPMFLLVIPAGGVVFSLYKCLWVNR